MNLTPGPAWPEYENLAPRTRPAARGVPSGTLAFPIAFRGVESTTSELPLDLALFRQHFDLVEAYVQGLPGARAALLAAARRDPEGVTTSIVALGAVLLDIAAGAFGLAPEQMLAKVGAGVGRMGSDAIPEQSRED